MNSIDDGDDLRNRIQDSWMAMNVCFDFDFSVGFEKIKNGTISDDDYMNKDVPKNNNIKRVSTIYGKFFHAVQTMIQIWCGIRLDAKEITIKWFANLLSLHSRQDRAYHTFCHIEEMIGYLDILFPKDDNSWRDGISSDEAKAYDVVTLLSIFFHDSIYDGKSSTNEEDSLCLYQTFEKEVYHYILENQHNNDHEIPIQWQFSNQLSIFILATKSHTIDYIKLDEDKCLKFLKAFLDADMAVLGKHDDAYDHYASLIRKEYIHVPHKLYCEKRAEVLHSFVTVLNSCDESSNEMEKRPKLRFIFSSQVMRDALEERAVHNLQREINLLKQGIIPGSK